MEIWPALTPAAAKGFALYGGTAIALQLGHRRSVDFDFFTDRNFTTREIRQAFPFLAGAKVMQARDNTYSALTKNGARLSFFGAIDFGRVGEPLAANDNKIQVASLDDLLATKLKALFDRVEYKDYKDIAAMLEHGVDLPKGLAAARAMFGDNFSPGEALKAMTYFQGGDLDQLTRHDKQVSLEAARQVRMLPQVQIVAKKLCLEPLREKNG
ncbi:MAG: nucleotidyl transferase AbiEii/AbiGii toxin family protein [Deltaproteobacteria bacterium]|nr:nucleotidyl transferase AbiEii/AbiGii toxin family protein [Deltaproteobacteria bacterium]